MSESLSREQLLDYIKKQKLKIKKLEGKNAELIAQADVVSLATTSTVAVTSDANSDELDECLEKIGILEDSLEAKNKELRDFQNSTKNKIKVLENDVSSKNSEILLLQEKLSEDADALADHLKTIETLKDAYNTKHNEWESQCQLVSDLQTKLAAVQGELSAATAATPIEEPPSACSECSIHVESISKLDQTVSKYKNMMKTKMKEMESLKQQIPLAVKKREDELLLEMDKLRCDVKEKHSAIDSRNTALVNAETELNEMAGKIATLLDEAKASQAREEHNEMKFSEEKRKLQDDIEELNKVILNFDNLQAETDQRIQLLNNQSQEACKISATRIEQLEQKLASRQTDAQNSDELLCNQLEEVSQREQACIAERKVMENCKCELESQIQSLQEELSSAQDQIQHLVNNNDVELKRKESYDKQVLELTGALNTTEKELQTARKELELLNSNVESENVKRQNREIEFQAEIAQLKTQMESTTVALSAAEPTSSSASVSQISGGNTKKSRKRNNKNKASTIAATDVIRTGSPVTEKTLDPKNSDDSKFHETIIALEAAVLSAKKDKESVVQIMTDQQNTMKMEINELKEEIDTLNTKESTLVADFTTQRKSIESEMNDLSALHEKDVADRDVLTSELQAKIDELTQFQANIDEEKSRIATEIEQKYLDKLSEMEVLLKAKEEEHKRNVVVDDELESEKRRVESLHDECEVLKCRLAEQSEVSTEAVDEQNRKTEYAMEENAHLSSSLDIVKKKVTELEVEVCSLSDTIKNLQSNISSKNDELVEINLKLEESVNTNKNSQEYCSSLENRLSTCLEELSQVVADKEQLQSRFEDLKNKSVVEAEEASAQLAATAQKVEELSSQISEQGTNAKASTCLNCEALQLSVETCTEKLVAAEGTVSKYKQMVKAKMKEINTLSESIKKAESNIRSLEEVNSVLEQQIRELTASLSDVERDVTTHEQIRANEHVELKETLSQYQSDLTSSRAIVSEREQELIEWKDKCTSLETCNATLIAQVAEKDKLIHQNNEEALRVVKDGTSESDRKVQELLERHSESSAQYELTISELKEEIDGEKKQVQNLKNAMAVVNENFTTKFEKERADTLAEQQVLNAKIKRLKALLAKSGASGKEKDAEIAQLRKRESESIEEQWSAFRVLMRVEDCKNSSGLPRFSAGDEQACDVWCLLVREVENPVDIETSVVRKRCSSKWVLESQMSTYMQDNKQNLVGEIPAQTIQQEHVEIIRKIEEGHLENINDLKAEISTVTQNFQAYKAKAHTALKRLGKDEHDERLKQRQAEDAEISQLRDEITSLQNEYEVLSLTAKESSERNSILQASVDELTKALSEAEDRVEVSVRKTEDVENNLSRAHESRTALENVVSGLKVEVEDLQEQVEALTNQLEAEKLETFNNISQDVNLASLPGGSGTSAILARTRTLNNQSSFSSDHQRNNSAISTKSEADGGIIRSVDSMSSKDVDDDGGHSSIGPNGNSTLDGLRDNVSMKTTSNLMAVNEAARYSQEINTQLREDLSTAILERTDLQNMISLNEEQIEALKETVRELEASLARELEFNESNRTINKEYLVNILRKFLMTKEASEHAKLVPVLCSILHFLPDETKAICEKWALVQSRGGLLGWLGGGAGATTGAEHNNRSGGGENSVIEDMYKIGSGNMDIY